MRQKKIRPTIYEEPYILCDMLGDEVSVGDIVVFSQGTSYSSYLSVAIIMVIKRCPRTARVYYKIGNDYWDKSYVTLNLSDSGKPCTQFLRLENPEFQINNSKIAKLLVMKIDMDNAAIGAQDGKS